MKATTRTEDSRVYVIVVHIQSSKAYALNRNYALIGEIKFDLNLAADNNIQVDNGWKPTFSWQNPSWAAEIPGSHFRAYWFNHEDNDLQNKFKFINKLQHVDYTKAYRYEIDGTGRSINISTKPLTI